MSVYLLDYGAGNVASIRNAIRKLGYQIIDVARPEDFARVDKLIFPGVGAFGAAVEVLKERNLFEPLRNYIRKGGLFFGICIGMQMLFEGSDESPSAEGLGVLPGRVRRLDTELAVPHIGWNSVTATQPSAMWGGGGAAERYYFVHSYAALPGAHTAAVTAYGRCSFAAAAQHGRVFATQFHPEKSGAAGVALLGRFLALDAATSASALSSGPLPPPGQGGLARRVIACLDVRPGEGGRLVVTKGDQYDVHEKDGRVRDLGDPAALAARYYRDGADEVTFLNIAAHTTSPLGDQQMLGVLRAAAQDVFVPMTIGGGIRTYRDAGGREYSALEVAAAYFRAGADKVSIGSDAVLAAEAYHAARKRGEGAEALAAASSLGQIATRYGRQAVVVSIDPRRVYVAAGEAPCSPWGEPYAVLEGGGRRWWYQCTVKGGKEGRPCDVVQLVTAADAMGAGELLVNSMDADGTAGGFDLQLLRLVKAHSSLPVIASSGAGHAGHFEDAFRHTTVEAALAAGIFHRRQVTVAQVKQHLAAAGLPVRLVQPIEEPPAPSVHAAADASSK